MVVVPNIENMLSLSVRGKMGFSAAAGFARCGYSRCGASKDYGGIYQRKKTLAGWRVSRMRYYRPTNPQSEAQQAQRAKIALGWEAYADLTENEKVLLSKQARKLRISGPNLFMRRFLNSEI